jgi:hypothetical protein
MPRKVARWRDRAGSDDEPARLDAVGPSETAATSSSSAGPPTLSSLCRDRSLGLAPVVVDELLGPGDGGGMAARRRRTRFAVAPVVAALVVTVALAALAYAALPDPSGPHWVSGRTGRHLVENGRQVMP